MSEQSRGAEVREGDHHETSIALRHAGTSPSSSYPPLADASWPLEYDPELST